nr:reverse transcriptase domain-containing protein [Tanacetum cinerariifolium]
MRTTTSFTVRSNCFHLLVNMKNSHKIFVDLCISAFSTVISVSKEEVIELDDSLCWAEVSQSLWRNQFFQGVSHGQNLPPAYQAPAYQAPVHQPQIPQPLVVTTNEFTNFMKVNDVILKNMQTNMTSLTNSNLELKNMFGQFMKMNTASSLGSETLSGPTIPTTSSSLPPVVDSETEATKDTVHPTNKGSTKDVQPPVVQTESLILNSEPVVSQHH